MKNEGGISPIKTFHTRNEEDPFYPNAALGDETENGAKRHPFVKFITKSLG